MNKTIILWIVGIIASIALVLSIGNAVGGNSQPVQTIEKQAFGGVTNFDTLAGNGFKVGSGCNDSNATCAGTTFTGFVGSTCNLIGTDASQAATSTVAYDCAVTNLTSSFSVIAQLATTTSVVAGKTAGWLISASGASTTAGFATVLVTNLTGAAAVPSVTAVGSSTKIWAFK